jgi:hypothetical protein
MDQDGSPPQKEWINQRIQEGINTALGPMQAQLAELLQRSREAAAEQPDPYLSVPESQWSYGAHTPPSETPVRRRPLPDPPKFSGKRNEYAAWAQDMRNKIRHDAPIYQYDPRALWYIINSCLDTSPRQLVSTFYAAGGPEGRHNPEDFMEYLDRTYKDPNAAIRATDELRRMRQREGVPFTTFLPKFEQVLSDAGGAAWADSAKIAFLKGAINKQLARSVVLVKMPDDYNGWVVELQRIASGIENLQRSDEATRPRRTSHQQYYTTPLRATDADGDIKMAKVDHRPAKRQQPHRESSLSSGDDMRTCHRCGQAGHLARGCLSKRKEQRIARTTPRERSRSVTPPTEESDSERRSKD